MANASIALCRRTSVIVRALVVAVACGLATSVRADVDVASSPLFVVPPVKPALMMAIDDSGSMDSEVLFRSNDGALWWHTGDESFTGRDMTDGLTPGTINFNLGGGANNTWKKFVYLFPNGTGLSNGRRAYSDSNHDHYAVPPIGAFGFARSPQYNFAYFDPASTYTPWPSLSGRSFGDVDPSNAPTDPVKGSETFDLTAQREKTGNNHEFRLYPGMVIPAGTRYRPGSNWTTTSSDVTVNSSGSDAFSYFPATFYLDQGTALPEGYGFRTDAGIPDGVNPSGGTMIRYEIRPANFVDTTSYERAIQNFANWFSYYRKRHLATRGAIAAAFENIAGFRVGTFYINNRINSVPMRDLSVGADRNDFFEQVFTTVNSGGTPNREAVKHMIGQFARTGSDAPIQLECQMNFGMLFTDGYATTHNPGVGNRDESKGVPYADEYSNTMADIAAALYLDNPRPDLPAGKVPVPAACRTGTAQPWVDCNDNLHVNFFALSLGAPGTIYDPALASLSNDAQIRYPYEIDPPIVWPDPSSTRGPRMVDDLWHATINGRGLFLNVDQPAQLGAKFEAVLDEIAARLESASTSAAASSAILQSDTLLYAAGFRTDDWSGTLTGSEINATGVVGAGCTGCWDAEALLAARSPASRNIFTRKTSSADGGSGGGVAFDWSQLSNTQKSALNHAPDGTEDNLGDDRVDWLWGTDLSGFRSRSESGTIRRLGDIVHSDPVFYNNVLYVGANDGMLHAFDATTGVELFAYVPSELLLPESGKDFAPLSRLMATDYTHRYFVDGKLNVVTVGSQTLLIGTMGAGGRTIFALDVSDPGNFGASDVLWEFRHDELGYNTGQPQVARMNNDSWAVIVGNGVNSDSDQSGIFVIDLISGSELSFISTGVGSSALPNGMNAPFVTDWPKRDQRVNRIFAGDLLGNVWEIDTTGNANSWKNNNNRRLAFKAKDGSGNAQPITSRPHAALLDQGELMLVFGTGSYFRAADASDAQVQSLYGLIIKEGASSTFERGDLLEQEIVRQAAVSVDGFVRTVREISDYVLDQSVDDGWFIDLDTESGERVISGPRTLGVDERRVRFSTLVPETGQCSAGRRGFFMDIDLVSGGRTEVPVFDLNEDGMFDDDDLIDATDEDGNPIRIPPNGIDFGTGEQILEIEVIDETNPLQSYQLICDGQGNCERARPDDLTGGRLSWREVRP